MTLNTMHLFTCCWMLTFAGLAIGAEPQDAVLESPDKGITIRFEAGGETSRPRYSVSFRGKTLLQPSELGIDLAPAGALGPKLEVTGIARRTSDTTYKVFPGKTNSARDHYNEAAISLAERGTAKRKLELIFRAYDDGVAFRYRVPAQDGLADFTVTEERSSFQIEGNPTAYALPVKTFETPYEIYYQPQPLKSMPAGELLGLPLLMQYADKTCMAITEAHLQDYAGMYVVPTTGTAGLLSSALSPLPGNPGLKVKAKLPHDTPWRVIMIGDHPGRLVESNLVNNLNPPSVIADTSWIKPGKTTFPWWNGFEVGEDAGFEGGLNTQTMMHYIDFCAESGFEYHSLDGFKNVAWYGGPIVPYKGAGITESLPEIDLPEVIRYAKEKKVPLRLWMNWMAAQKHMKDAFPLYEKWGIEGVMLDFFNRDDQEVVNFIHDVVALAAKHKMTVTLHNLYKPTGLNRTYPNLMTYEAVLNLEYNKWNEGSTPKHELIVPFTRMLAGPLDYHAGSFRHVSEKDFKASNIAPVVKGTRARELARFVVYENYLPMASDYPAAYRGEEGLDVLVKMPVTWDETRVLDGAVGAHITIARRSGKNWYVGSMTDSDARDLQISLNFLGDGNYTAEIYGDDLPEGGLAPNLNALNKRQLKATAKDVIPAKLGPAGGHLIILKPE